MRDYIKGLPQPLRNWVVIGLAMIPAAIIVSLIDKLVKIRTEFSLAALVIWGIALGIGVYFVRVEEKKKANAVLLTGMAVYIMTILVGWIAQHIYFSEPIVTTLAKSYATTASSISVPATANILPEVNMGALPGDICVIDGKPQVVDVSSEDHYGYPILVYLRKDGAIVALRYGGGFDSQSQHAASIRYWTGGSCPADKK